MQEDLGEESSRSRITSVVNMGRPKNVNLRVGNNLEKFLDKLCEKTGFNKSEAIRFCMNYTRVLLNESTLGKRGYAAIAEALEEMKSG